MKPNGIMTRLWQGATVRQARQAVSPTLWYRYATAHRRRLPDFLIVGAMKAGTTSLFGCLAGHPDCCASYSKEVHYFDRNFHRGESWYRMHFPRWPSRRTVTSGHRTLCFESSPYYMFEPRVPARVRRELPKVKLVFLLRNPVDRAYSHYQHCVVRGRESLPFEAAIDVETQRLKGEVARLMDDESYHSPAHQHFSYLQRGLYADQIVRWQQHFPRENLLVVQAEQLFRNPQQMLARTLAFLGLDDRYQQTFNNRYQGRYRCAMDPATRRRLTACFSPHNERLFDILGERYDWS